MTDFGYWKMLRCRCFQVWAVHEYIQVDLQNRFCDLLEPRVSLFSPRDHFAFELVPITIAFWFLLIFLFFLVPDKRFWACPLSPFWPKSTISLSSYMATPCSRMVNFAWLIVILNLRSRKLVLSSMSVMFLWICWFWHFEFLISIELTNSGCW